MDRLDAMEAFVVTVDIGSLSAAARTLGCSAASVTRAVAALEDRLGVLLLRRTTRSLHLTEAGESFVIVARRVLADVAEAERSTAGALSLPQGDLTVTAPLRFGTLYVRPIVDAYLATHADVRVRLLLVDRVVNIIDEGVDAAVRIAHLPDSSLLATKVGDVKRLVCASPAYLDEHGRPREPQDLHRHRVVSSATITPSDTWTFSGGRARTRHVKVRPVLTVNTAEAAIDSAIDGQGITCALSYQVADAILARRLVPVLTAYEPDPLPVHLVYPAGSSAAKLRAFVELAVPRLKAALTSRPSRRSHPRSASRGP